MNIKTRIFNNFDGSDSKSKDKFTTENERMFQEHMPDILKSWGKYLKTYVEQSGNIFPAPELPWRKFDEPTWVSSLAIAIAKKYPDALLIEELPVTKKGVKVDSNEKPQEGAKGKKSDLGNADMWCCLNPFTEKNGRFCFYLEAKFGSWSRRNLDNLQQMNLVDVHDQIASNTNKNSLLSRVFRDYQKSAGKSAGAGNYVTKSPHQKEEGRKHDHVFLGMLIKPIKWNDKESWPRSVKFPNLFKDKIKVHATKSVRNYLAPSKRNIYNFPCAGLLLKDDKGNGFVSLIIMLGEAKAKVTP